MNKVQFSVSEWMNLKNNDNELKKKKSIISEINITKFEWLRVKSTLNDAAKRVPFHYNQNKSWWWATACTGKSFCCWINMVCRTMKGKGSFKRICSASVVQVQFFYGTRKMFCLSYSGWRVNNSSLARYYNYYIIESHEIPSSLCIWQTIFCRKGTFLKSLIQSKYCVTIDSGVTWICSS